MYQEHDCCVSAKTIYRLVVLAINADINEVEIYSDYEEARHNFENWKYDTRVMENHGCVSLTQMMTDPESENPGKFFEVKDLGDHQW